MVSSTEHVVLLLNAGDDGVLMDAGSREHHIVKMLGVPKREMRGVSWVRERGGTWGDALLSILAGLAVRNVRGRWGSK